MNKEDIYRMLKEKGYWFEVTAHGAVYNMAELEMPYQQMRADDLAEIIREHGNELGLEQI